MKAQGKLHALIACLVDFEKAFDKAHRRLMLRRLKELGVTGKFYDALVALYDKIQMVVSVNGEQGTPFDTHQGTKQGSELSPIIFGLFIEQLHYLLQHKVPGAGPRFQGVQVPDIMYADDVNLMVVDSPEQMQLVLDVLQLFCDLFAMRVNMNKTKLLIFRSGKEVPPHLSNVTWTYQGQPLAISAQEKYLGVVMHESQDMCSAADHRGAVGSNSLHGMMVMVAQNGLQRPDIICDLFDKLVRPVLSYGAHIWGPYMFTKWFRDPLNPSNRPEKVHTQFLRQLSGMGKSVHKPTLYKEFGREPLMVQWLVLAARLWNKMCDRDDKTLIHMAFLDNIMLMLRSKKCWAWHFMRAMSTIGVLDEKSWQVQGRKTAGNLKEALGRVVLLSFDEEEVEIMAKRFFNKPWVQCKDKDPTKAPTNQVFRSTYKNWIGLTSWGAKHMQHFMPMHLRRELVGIRCGCHPLNVHRQRFDKIPRAERLCTVCDTGAVEDVKHFMLQCDQYALIRAKYTHTFSHAHATASTSDEVLRSVFNHEHQLELATCVHEMLSYRETMLQTPEQMYVKEERLGRIRDIELPYIVDMMEDDGSGLKVYDPVTRGLSDLPDGWYEFYQ